MNNKLWCGVVGLVACLTLPAAQAQFGDKPATLSLVKVQDDLYVIHNDYVPGNTTALITNQGVILVDDKFEIDHDGIMAMLKTVTNQPVKYVINTHFHGDHSGGNAKMQAGGTLAVASAQARVRMIEGKMTGLKSKAMTSPCGKIRIPINESSDDKSQIEEFLKRYNGEGIQHIALGTNDIYTTVESLQKTGVDFQSTLDTYYKNVNKRVPGHGEDLVRMQSLNILVDGAPTKNQGLLLQIFTKDAIGPIFFEIIQRKGNEGFGEGNFKALFESIELDQIRRGVLKAE